MIYDCVIYMYIFIFCKKNCTQSATKIQLKNIYKNVSKPNFQIRYCRLDLCTSTLNNNTNNESQPFLILFGLII